MSYTKLFSTISDAEFFYLDYELGARAAAGFDMEANEPENAIRLRAVNRWDF